MMQRLSYLWPVVLLLSACLALAVYGPWSGLVLRPLVMLWFLSICPGMALVRFLRLREPITEWTLAVATSLSLDTLVASIQLYAGRWSPTLTLHILISICVIGVLAQLLVIRFARKKEFSLG